MSKLKQMENFLEGDPNLENITQDNFNEYWKEGDIWQKIASMELEPPIPCLDISLEYRDEEDDYGVNFSKKQRVFELFFTGSSDYFPAIWIGDENEELLDQLPIYIFDLSCSTDPDEIIHFKPEGNFRTYIEIILNFFIENYDKDDEYMKTALWMKEEIKKFSTNCIVKGNYILNVIEE